MATSLLQRPLTNLGTRGERVVVKVPGRDPRPGTFMSTSKAGMAVIVLDGTMYAKYIYPGFVEVEE